MALVKQTSQCYIINLKLLQVVFAVQEKDLFKSKANIVQIRLSLCDQFLAIAGSKGEIVMYDVN